MKTAKQILCIALTTIVWVAIGAALLNAGLARQFEPERDCDGSAAMDIVCR
jgi:hypothetical protein